MIAKQATAKRTRRRPAKEIEVVFDPIAPEVEAELVDRLARFLLMIASIEKEQQPHATG